MDIPTFRHMDDFSLISSRAFIVTILHPSGAIKVYPFKAPGDTQWTLDRVVAPLPPPNQAFASLDSPICMEPRRCAILSFPSLTPSTVYSEISSDTAPFTTSHDAGKLFHTSEDVRVHLMSVRTKPQRRMNTIPYNWQSGKMISSYTVIVANRILLEQAERARSVFKGEELHVRWDEWGPQNTRWLSGPYDRAWLRWAQCFPIQLISYSILCFVRFLPLSPHLLCSFSDTSIYDADRTARLFPPQSKSAGLSTDRDSSARSPRATCKAGCKYLTSTSIQNAY